MARNRRRTELGPEFFETGENPYESSNVVRRACKVEIGKLSHGAFARVKERKKLQQEDRDEAIAANADRDHGAKFARGAVVERKVRRRLKLGQLDKLSPSEQQLYFGNLVAEMNNVPEGGDKTTSDYVRRREYTHEFFGLITAPNTPLALRGMMQQHIGGIDSRAFKKMLTAYTETNADCVCPPKDLLATVFRHGAPAVVLDLGTAYDMLLTLTDKRRDIDLRSDVFDGMANYAYIVKKRQAEASAERHLMPGDLAVFCRSFLSPDEARAGTVPRRRRSTRARPAVPSYHDPLMVSHARAALKAMGSVMSHEPKARDKRVCRIIRTVAITALAKARAAHGYADPAEALAEQQNLPALPPRPVPAGSDREFAKRMSDLAA